MEAYSPQMGKLFQLQEFAQSQSVPVNTSSFTNPTLPLCWLPLPEYKDGIAEISYYRSSVDHLLMSELIQTMEARNGSFLYRQSRPLYNFENLSRTHNVLSL